jgi:hypothetical protein
MLDDPVSLVILGRIAERFCASIGAIIALWCGFRLFYTVATQDSTAEIVASGYKFAMTKVGPGIFFALFGSIILVYSITSHVSFSSEELSALKKSPAPASEAQQSTQSLPESSRAFKYRGIAGTRKDDIPILIRAVNTLVDMADRQGQGTTKFSERETALILKSVSKLKDIQRSYIDNIIRDGAFDEYVNLEQSCLKNEPPCQRMQSNKARNDQHEKIRSTLQLKLEEEE